MSNKADSGRRTELNSFEEVVKFDGKSFSKSLNMFVSSSLIGRTYKNSTIVPDFETIFEKNKILSWSLISMNKDDNMLFLSIFRLFQGNRSLKWHDRIFHRVEIFSWRRYLSKSSFGKMLYMNSRTHGNSRWESSILFLTEIIFINFVTAFELFWTHWSFCEKHSSHLIHLFKYLYVFALFLEKVFTLNWKVISPELLFFVFLFVHFCLLKVCFPTVLVSTTCPVPVLLHLMTECMGPQSLDFMSSVNIMVVICGFRKIVWEQQYKIVPFLID